MATPRHPDWDLENRHLDYILDIVRRSLSESIADKQRIDHTVDQLSRETVTDSSLDYVDLSVNVLIQGSLALKLRNLEEAQRKPYFARIDFTEDDEARPGGKGEKEELYIGKMCLIREEDMKPVIIDWRAPVASLYYEERLGRAHYLCPKGDVQGDLTLKRQYTIENGVMQNLFDIDITTNDSFLQGFLGASADNRLKDIVSTIQAEQNRIIRAGMWTPLIVQGAAGSGKTTIALHRIAYLVYTHEKTFSPEAFMIIAPNTLFLDYISEILPELGVDRVRQTTFENFAFDLIGKRFKMRDPHEKLMLLAENKDPGRADALAAASRFKSSMRFCEWLDRFLDEQERNMLPAHDFALRGETLLPRHELDELFCVEYRRWPVRNRLDELKKHMKTALKRRKDAIQAKIEADCDRKVAKIRLLVPDGAERRAHMVRTYAERDKALKDFQKEQGTIVSDYVRDILKKPAYDHYREFIDWLGENAGDDPTVRLAAEWSKEVLASGRIELEDLAPLIHIRYRIHGMDEKIPVRHIVIDEAQDFSAFQMACVRRIIPDSSFTILGDLCQGIHSYRSLSSWHELDDEVFADRRTSLLTLEQSYRTTVEIMDAANLISARMAIPGVPVAKPVIRHGDPVRLLRDPDEKTTAAGIAEKLAELVGRGMKLLAVIGKTHESCAALHKSLKRKFPDIHLITGAEGEYQGGMMVVPAHLSKGLEFDGVVIADAHRYNDNLTDAKLLYVAMTRPMHVLDVHYIGEPTPMLAELFEKLPGADAPVA